METVEQQLKAAYLELKVDTPAYIVADWCEDRGHAEAVEFIRRSTMIGDRETFYKSVVGQDDDGDYEESGYVACVHNGIGFIGRYSHCSCYDTWTSLNGGGFSEHIDTASSTSWCWIGTAEELIAMAKRKADPDMPTRESGPQDSDHDHLMKCYKQVLDWAAKL